MLRRRRSFSLEEESLVAEVENLLIVEGVSLAESVGEAVGEEEPEGVPELRAGPGVEGLRVRHLLDDDPVAPVPPGEALLALLCLGGLLHPRLPEGSPEGLEDVEEGHGQKLQSSG